MHIIWITKYRYPVSTGDIQKKASAITYTNMGDALFLDVRTPAEVNYLGVTSVVDANVPTDFMDGGAWNDKKSRYRRKHNKNFVADVEKHLKDKDLTKNDTVILMCRSGKRSAKAVNVLAKAGFKKVYEEWLEELRPAMDLH